MPAFRRLPRFVFRLIQQPPRLLYAAGMGHFLGKVVLLLTTTGRKSGLPRVTPLQYEEIDEVIYIGSARGVQADWFRNIIANPEVEIRIGSRLMRGLAQPITDSKRIADFLEVRLRRHPRMVSAMLRAEGLSVKPNRQQLLNYAEHLAVVGIRPYFEEEV